MNVPDSRTIDWFLVGSPVPVLIICMSYIYLVLYLGPKLMRNRSPFDLSTIIMVFNAIQIVHNVWMLNEALQAGWWRSYNLLCQPVDYSSSPQALRMANLVWHYYINKSIDLLDTVFFVLRKKNNQITPLHVFHHAGMPAVGGHCTLTALLNTFIHSLMYFYYFVAALGPSFKKYLWWKKYLTVMQMIAL
uniref:Elongation of very long chain fatty acids protein n=1 Tax=Timema poppense TaxID=170557 RepID=A0A7R9GYK2_TIMPO|nr:unnamed protein product [Timema poppensis]